MTSPRAELPTGTSSTPARSAPQQVLVIFGTRPEAIKLCPVIRALRSGPWNRDITVSVCVTAQHREMLDQVLAAFQVEPDYDLNLMQAGQTLAMLSARLLESLEPVIVKARPKIVMVQGDTTTTLCGALAAFYMGVPVAHVEAGLRTFDMRAPFPEEMNRIVVTRLSSLHFAATEWAASNLRAERVPADSILVTGNTGIDAVLSVREVIAEGGLKPAALGVDPTKRLIVVTAHRRESFGDGLSRICQAISQIARRGDVQIIWPVHLNPQMQQVVRPMIQSQPNVLLIEPLDYVPFVDLMSRAYLLITDSGGIQEEGPPLGKPVLVLRDTTERPEGVEAGTVKLVGTDPEKIVAETECLLNDANEYERMAHLHNPYGDGKASGRIAERVASYLA